MILFVSFSEQRCAIDDDLLSFKVTDEESNTENMISSSATTQPEDRSTSDVDIPARNGAISINHHTAKHTDDIKLEAPLFNLAKHLSCKWSTATGPRISCVRDYPTELQSRALEQVNLSPRLANGPFFNYGPIPSPRPSPKVHLSPRLSFMGLPSPKTAAH